MQRFIPFLLLLLALNVNAQWKSDPGLGGKLFVALSYGIHDSTLFACLTYPNNRTPAGLIGRNRSSMSWFDANNGIDWSFGTSVTTFASLGRYVFAGTIRDLDNHNGCYRSSDNGSKWIGCGGSPLYSNGRYLFASSGTSVYRSIDSGNSWQGVPCPATNAFGSLGANVVASISSGVELSTDSGSHWSKVIYPLSAPLCFVTIDSTLFAAGYIVNDTYQIITGPKGLTFSTDRGSSWHAIALEHWIQCLATHGHNLFVGTLDSGVYVSTDLGETWTQKNEGLGTSLSVQAMAVFDTVLYLSSGTDGNYFNGYRPLSELVPPKSAVVQEIPSRDTLELYPNPTLGTVTIRSGEELQHIELLNVLGVKLRDIASRDRELTLDLSQLASGTYFLQIQTSKGIITRKIVRE